MIRTTVALFVFAILICGLIIFQPYGGGDTLSSDPPGTSLASDVEVTRAASQGVDALALAAQAALAPKAAAATSDRVVVQAPRRVDVVRPDTDDTDLSDMTNNVLAQLGFSGMEPITTNSQAQRQSTSEILAGIEAATGLRSVLEQRQTLEEIVIAALRAGETDETIDIIVNEAAVPGNLTVP